jgi:glycosyltransferase involved in cell wall biosynthesis
MRILITTDSFPPGCGGSGWSTYELARGLRVRGHDVIVVRPRPGHPDGWGEYDGFAVREIGVASPDRVPFLRNYVKNERLYARLRPLLAQLAVDARADLVHAQHVMTIPPSVAAAAQAGVPSVATVRDYWPVCYWSDLMHDPGADGLCPGCSPAMMRRCVRPRAGAAWPLAIPLVPYMRANLRRKQEALAQAQRVVGVSSTITTDLLERAAGLSRDRVVTIPNPVDVAAIRAAAEAGRPGLDHPYALYLGKLAPNKGTPGLIRAIERAGLPWPLVVIGDGPDRPMVEQWARDSRREVRLLGWLPREQALGWLAQAAVLVFPSRGPESLSRVLLEAGALGVPTAAMDTGGTRDIVIHDRTGLLSADAEALGGDVARLVADRPLALRLGAGARAHVDATFASDRVVPRIEALYRELVHSRTSDGGEG